MVYSVKERLTNTRAAMLGYGNSLNETGVPIIEFQAGDGAIVITNKGEPVMSGLISEIRYPDEDYMGSQGSIKIGDRWYGCESHYFRKM